MQQSNNKYQLEERTAIFAENTLSFCKTLEITTISKPLISQLVRSATSIGANYMEANNASSRKDFQNKIFICKKEAQETKYWLRMILRYFPDKTEQGSKLQQEVQEFLMIFQRIVTTLRQSLNVKIENSLEIEN